MPPPATHPEYNIHNNVIRSFLKSNMEYSQLLAKKKDAYAAYRDAKEQARELLTHRENLRPYLAPQEASQRAKRPEQIER